MVNGSSPKVSIGLPVFNGEKYLAQALDSLLNQTLTDFELIISDNCSYDDTIDIVEQYARDDSRIRLIRQEKNLGAIGNFNFVFHQARAEYFKWAAHDDVCDASFLSRCVEALDRMPEVVWTHCKSDQIDIEGNSWLPQLHPSVSDSVEMVNGRLQWAGFPRLHHDSPSASQRFAGVLLGGTWAVDCYGLIRTRALKATRMLLPYYGAEKVLTGELALQGPYFHIEDQLFAQRIHDEASGNIRSSRFQSTFALGSKKGKAFAPTRLALLTGHLGAVRRAKVSSWERQKCYLAVLRYVFQVRKWRKIAMGTLLGRGIGGEGVRQLREEASAYSNAKAD